MKLIDFLNDIDIEIEEDDLLDTLSKLKRGILIAELRDFRDCRIDDYLSVKDGVSRSAYVLNDLEKDAFEISRRIEALDMILDEYVAGHEPFDFDSVEWWDDKEGLS